MPALAVILAAAVSIPAIGQIRADGRTGTPHAIELGADGTPRRATATPSLRVSPDGYAIDGHASGLLSVPVQVDGRRRGERQSLRVWAYGSGAVTGTLVVRARGRVRDLGSPGEWIGKTFDMSDLVPVDGGRLILSATVRNRAAAPALFLDRIATIANEPDARPTATRWLVALWLALLVIAVLAVTGRLMRHWPLPVLVAIGGYALWGPAVGAWLDPLAPGPSSLWTAVRGADSFDLHSGLLSGSFGELSALAVQVFHALTPITGGAAAAARTASVLVGIAALCAVYAFGNRVAGRVGAVVGGGLLLLADPLRDAAASGAATTTLLLAATLFGLATHIALARAGREELVLLGGAGAIAALADATWIPGVLLTMGLVVLLYGIPGYRLRALGAGLLVLGVLITPHLISVADQGGGSVTADLTRRATIARDIEFPGRAGARRVGLAEYVFGDHSIGAVVGTSLTGAYDALAALARHPHLGVAWLFGFVLIALGALYLLLVPRLRALILLALLLALPSLFLARWMGVGALDAGTPLWPPLLVAGGVLAYVTLGLAAERFPVLRRVVDAESVERFDLPIPEPSPDHGPHVGAMSR